VIRKLNNILPNLFEKVAKNGKIYATMLYLKSWNINMKPVFFLILNIYIKPRIETVLFGQNWLNKKQSKVAQVANLVTLNLNTFFKKLRCKKSTCHLKKILS
jgi:hypothetical protein